MKQPLTDQLLGGLFYYQPSAADHTSLHKWKHYVCFIYSVMIAVKHCRYSFLFFILF